MDRPLTWDDYIGQDALKERLQVHIASAVERGVRMDHVLLIGPPGCGKTTLAGIIAKELSSPLGSYVMPLKDRALKAVILSERGVVLLDEIHRAAPKQQEEFLTVIEDGYLQLPNGTKMNTHPYFMVVAATTEPDKVIKPLYDRFPIVPVFEEYTDEEMLLIIRGMAAKEGLDISNEVAIVLGQAAGGIPRNAFKLVCMARDLGVVNGKPADADEILKASSITPDGLNRDQIKYLCVLKNAGGTAGIDVVASHLRLPKSVIMDNERLLVKKNYIQYTPSGRELTGDGWEIARSAE